MRARAWQGGGEVRVGGEVAGVVTGLARRVGVSLIGAMGTGLMTGQCAPG